MMILPALGYAQETGVEFGLASTYDFYMDPQNVASRTSNMTFMATLTSNKQKNIKLNTDIWTNDNDYHIMAEIRYRDWPLYFYGLGNKTHTLDKDYIGQKLVRAKVDVERKISPHLYAGINAHFDHFNLEDIEKGGIFEDPAVLGKEGGHYLALGTSLLFDNRNVTTYTTKGSFLRLKYAYAPDFWKKDHFSGGLLEMDSRYFISPLPKLTFAIQALYKGSFGKHIPYYIYRELGGDSAMRGYYLGRYRDRNYATIQSEIRFRTLARVGAVAFGGLGSTFSDQYPFRTLPSYGLGIRYFFSLEHQSTVRLDYAIGEKRPSEKRQSGFYLSLSEAF
ncbi:BamA/TamA family outer membrane protein [Sphingobacterium sp. SGG-5]|uniref:BamA/TamA family outer membrane protein n=1 Tax=Sphingobacterium sp. SGG-5 TaxID=2710881 RepID=UPI001F115ED0|nr:BamA/TamA family outer membrane protein [Sphingobacterium sp. SGG-5]